MYSILIAKLTNHNYWLFQAVVTEYLIKYCELIFADKLPPFITPTTATSTSTTANNSKLSPSPSEGSSGGDTSATPRVATKMRPKSLAISTPTKLLSLEEARNRALNQVNLLEAQNKYIEVGGGPENLPSRYHTVIELPAGKDTRQLVFPLYCTYIQKGVSAYFIVYICKSLVGHWYCSKEMLKNKMPIKTRN